MGQRTRGGDLERRAKTRLGRSNRAFRRRETERKISGGKSRSEELGEKARINVYERFPQGLMTIDVHEKLRSAAKHRGGCRSKGLRSVGERFRASAPRARVAPHKATRRLAAVTGRVQGTRQTIDHRRDVVTDRAVSLNKGQKGAAWSPNSHRSNTKTKTGGGEDVAVENVEGENQKGKRSRECQRERSLQAVFIKVDQRATIEEKGGWAKLRMKAATKKRQGNGGVRSIHWGQKAHERRTNSKQGESLSGKPGRVTLFAQRKGSWAEFF